MVYSCGSFFLGAPTKADKSFTYIYGGETIKARNFMLLNCDLGRSGSSHHQQHFHLNMKLEINIFFRFSIFLSLPLWLHIISEWMKKGAKGWWGKSDIGVDSMTTTSLPPTPPLPNLLVVETFLHNNFSDHIRVGAVRPFSQLERCDASMIIPWQTSLMNWSSVMCENTI